MNEREALNQSKEQLKESFGELTGNLKEYGKAFANHIKARFLNFKENVKQKVTSAKGKLGTLKNDMLQKLNPANLDVRFRDVVEKAEIKGLELSNKGKEAFNIAKDKVTDFAAQQYANYHLSQEEKMNEELEREQLAAEEMQREAEIKANTKEHKEGMKEALREQARQEIETRLLNFKESVKQKVTSAKGKLGTLKNDMLQKLSPENLDVRFRDVVESVEIKGLEFANKGKEAFNTAKDKVTDFAAQQYANYHLRQEEKASAKEFKEAAKLAEMEEIQRVKERKAAMKEAIYSNEREMYEQKHIDNQQRKEELMNQLFGPAEEMEELHTAKAM